ncbi:MAG: chemotaxis protein CheB [Cellvibrionaceae bacterium]|nr:chemotaxis protein CheB [Cellvibrionaceae bacterium]
MGAKPGVGIVCQTLVQQHHLRHIITRCGYHCVNACLIDQVLDDINQLNANSDDIHLWLIDVDMSSLEKKPGLTAFDNWLTQLREPVIFGEGTTYSAMDNGFHSWSRQLHEKLLSLGSEVINATIPYKKPQALWVLAASTGGPEAVKQFLDHLPADLGIALLYVQHIEARQNRPLAETITRDSAYSSCLATQGDYVQANTVTLIPADQEVTLLANGMIMFRDTPWRGLYQPSIDQVVANVADTYGARAGAIFFSGMGSDGVVGARLMARRSGAIWVQTPASCASDMMPNAVKKTGCASAIGTPLQLAARLGEIYAEEEVGEPEPS